MTLVAKPLVTDKLWILLHGHKKVGNVKAQDDGYVVNIGKFQNKFSSTDTIEQFTKIEFERPSKKLTEQNPLFNIWPTNGKPYNSMLDIKKKIHLYTKTSDSRCYYASGWYRLKINDTWQTQFCPKYIFIQRYEYSGPHMTQEQAELA